MNEFNWAVAAAKRWVENFGGEIVGLKKQMDGRWFAEVATGDKGNWCSERNMFLTRYADLGTSPEIESHCGVANEA